MKRKVLLKSLSIALVSICLILALVFNPKQTLSSNAEGTVVDSGSCGDNVKWKIDDEGNFYLYTDGDGNGQMEDNYHDTWGTTNYPWEDYRNDITNVYIQGNVSIINNGAFLNCPNLKDVFIGKNVKKIGKRAFYNCDSLSTVSFEANSSCTTIGYNAFSYSDSPSIDISLPESINTIEGSAFNDSFGAVIGISSWKFFNSDTQFTIFDYGVTYKLEKDIVAGEGDKAISIDRNINLDLNGHIIDGTALDNPAITVVGCNNCMILGDGSIKGNETAIYLKLIDEIDNDIGSISFVSGNINVSGLKNGIYVDPCTSTYYGGEIEILYASTTISGQNNSAILNGKIIINDEFNYLVKTGDNIYNSSYSSFESYENNPQKYLYAKNVQSDFDNLQYLILNNDNIELDKDYTFISGEESISIPANRNVVINLNGHNIYKNTNSAISVYGNLTVKDTVGGGKIYSDNTYNTIGDIGVYLNQNASFTLESGCIKGFKRAGVFTRPGSNFTMTGGSILDNSFDGNSPYGNVYLNSATLNISGGQISGSTRMGGIYKNNGEIIISGNPVIKDNSPCDIGINKNETIKIKSALGENAYIGITPNSREKSLYFLEGINGYSYTDSDIEKFNSTSTRYKIEKDDSGKALLKLKLEDSLIFLTSYEAIYTGSAIEPDIVDNYSMYGYKIEKDKDYTVTYKKNDVVVSEIKDKGDYKVILTGIGECTGTIEFDFTVTKEKAVITEAPVKIENLVYNGNPQELITKGNCTGGTLMYSLDGFIYSEDVPTATNALPYIIKYKVFGDENHDDSEVYSILTSIGLAHDAPNMPQSTMVVSYEKKYLSDIELPDKWEWAEGGDIALDIGINQSHKAWYKGFDASNYSCYSQRIVITRQECTHNNIEYVSLKDSTCSEVGVKGHYECTICKKKFSDENGTTPVQDDALIINMLPHTEVAIDDVAPTCTQNGTTGGKKCSVCGTITEKPTVVNALGHNWGEWKRVKNPTTTETGLDERVCKNDPSHKETRVLNKLATPSNQNNNNAKKQVTNKPEKKYSNEWIGGKWYSADGSQSYKPVGKWNYNGTGWWFEDTSGYYPKSEWQKIEGKWYYFKSSGYMAKSEYIDGYWITSNGSMSETYNGGRWASDSTGWWYVDSTGYYPASEWVWIDEKCYYFKGNGYMATNQTIDGNYVGADGAWQQ